MLYFSFMQENTLEIFIIYLTCYTKLLIHRKSGPPSPTGEGFYVVFHRHFPRFRGNLLLLEKAF